MLPGATPYSTAPFAPLSSGGSSRQSPIRAALAAWIRKSQSCLVDRIEPPMEVLTKQDSDREELRSALNRMMEAAASWKRERAQLVAACDQLRRQVRDRESDTAVASDQRQGDSRAGGAVSASWDQEREQLLADRRDLLTQLSESQEGAGIALERQVAAAVDRVRAELMAENNRLREELNRSTDGAAQWAAERNQMLTELERTTQLLADTEEAAAIALDRQIVTAVKRVRA